MPRPPTWTIKVRCKNGEEPPLLAEVPAHSALEALASTVADLVAAPRPAARPSPRQLDATWPEYVTVLSHPSSTQGHQFSVTCRCGDDWGVQDRHRALYVLRESIPNHHGPGRCDERWPENRSPDQAGPLNAAGAEIRQRREAAKMTQAQLAKAVGVSPGTISTAERVLGRGDRPDAGTDPHRSRRGRRMNTELTIGNLHSGAVGKRVSTVCASVPPWAIYMHPASRRCPVRNLDGARSAHPQGRTQRQAPRAPPSANRRRAVVNYQIVRLTRTALDEAGA